MEKIYKIAEAKGITLIELDYWNENEAAKKFYERQGFSKRSEFAFREV
ncbi:ribosomal protein S18 acetylase RimI-like enzyme [Thalassobacillus pellis]|nr:ribosomal protein S18 acetylase RimI-like enzyme [Thalassobacillus pellis]